MFWPLSCRSANLGYSIHVTRAQFVVLSMAFFTFILYKSEVLQIETILVVIDVAIKFLLLLRILQNLWTGGGPSLTLFFLGMNVCKICYSWYLFFLYCNENSCYFCDFCDICGLFQGPPALFLSKS